MWNGSHVKPMMIRMLSRHHLCQHHMSRKSSSYPLKNWYNSTQICLITQVRLEVDSSVKPVIILTRRVPTALKQKLKEELNSYVEKGILVPVKEPMPWVSSLAIATKTSGALRVCIDPQPLNGALKWETCQILVLDEILPELSEAKVYLHS